MVPDGAPVDARHRKRRAWCDRSAPASADSGSATAWCRRAFAGRTPSVRRCRRRAPSSSRTSVSSKTAAALWLQGITAHYLSTSLFPLAPGHRALVHAAAGGVGLLLCQMAKRRGAFVIGTASTPEKRTFAHDAGADEMIDYTTQDFAVETRRITGGAGVHVVYDSVGQSTFDKSLDCLVPRGTMALFGQSSGRVPPFDPQILNRKGSLFLTRPTARALHRDARRAGAARQGPVRLGRPRGNYTCGSAPSFRSHAPPTRIGRSRDGGRRARYCSCASERGAAKPSGVRRGTCA